LVTVSCLIADDSERFPASATRLLSGQGLSIVGQAFSPDEALRLTEALSPGSALVDVEMGDEDGIALTGRLTVGGSTTTVIRISIRDRDELAGQIAGSGAAGFVRKDALNAQEVASLIVQRKQCNVGPEPPRVT
jgi:DNA-binding NarL/FixJ family response regulator